MQSSGLLNIPDTGFKLYCACGHESQDLGANASGNRGTGQGATVPNLALEYLDGRGEGTMTPTILRTLFLTCTRLV